MVKKVFWYTTILNTIINVECFALGKSLLTPFNTNPKCLAQIFQPVVHMFISTHFFFSLNKNNFNISKHKPHEALSLKMECKHAKISIFCTPIMQIYHLVRSYVKKNMVEFVIT